MCMCAWALSSYLRHALSHSLSLIDMYFLILLFKSPYPLRRVSGVDLISKRQKGNGELLAGGGTRNPTRTDAVSLTGDKDAVRMRAGVWNEE